MMEPDQNMPIRYKYLGDKNILISSAHGEISASDNAASNARVLEELERRPGLKLLVDLREAGFEPSPVVFLGMMEAFFELVGDRLPVAVVHTEVPNETFAMLAETQAFIAGAPMRIYDDRQDAINWLDRQ
jgi:hypothetical protein